MNELQRAPPSAEEPVITEPVIINFVVALGIGLLIGVERERRKGEGPARSPAGIRTFAVTSLVGAVSFAVGAELLLAVATAGVIALTAISYWRGRNDDPGLTSEIALVLTVLLGGLSVQQPALAGGLAVTVAVLLASRTRLHRIVRTEVRIRGNSLQSPAAAASCAPPPKPGGQITSRFWKPLVQSLAQKYSA